jgi:hypothetical protein
MVPPVLAESRAFLLKTAVETDAAAIGSAPMTSDPRAATGTETSATRGVIKSLVLLRTELLPLEAALLRVWSDAGQYPIDVFTLALQSRSASCIAILFDNLAGVREAGPLFSVLEQAAPHRLRYFTVRLSTPEGAGSRPDHTLWYAYPQYLDTCLRSPDFYVFSKISLLELGANIRQLRDQVQVQPEDSPKPGTEFAADTFMYHLCLLSFVAPWLTALGFPLDGKTGFTATLGEFSTFCQQGAHLRAAGMALHVSHIRSLYTAFRQDMHQAFECFAARKLMVYDRLVPVDSMFPSSGLFHGKLRQLKLDIANFNSANRGGVAAGSGAASVPALPNHGKKRSRQSSWESSPSPLPPPPAARSPANSSSSTPLKLGDLAWAVRDDPEFVQIFNTRYAKAPILASLRLTEADICLPSFLSRKGNAVCPHAGQAGHETATSTLHTFSSALALRQRFENAPFRVSNPDGSGSTSRGGGGRAGRGRWGQRHTPGHSQ